MPQTRTDHLAKVILVLMFAFAMTLIVAGCSSDEPAAQPTGATAKGSVETARSALSTIAPDAKLLVVQTAEGTTPTATPVWAYLFGSPSTDVTYLVYVADGTVMSAAEYGTAGLTAEEWPLVPGLDEWTVDSEEAYTNALAISGATGDPTAYYMGLQTYLPESMAASSTAEVFTWYVYFDPGASGATTGTIAVDAKTGDAEIVVE